MKFTLTTEKGSQIELEDGMTITLSIDEIQYEISVNKIENHANNLQ